MKKSKVIKVIIIIEVIMLLLLLCVAVFLFDGNDVKEPADLAQTTESAKSTAEPTETVPTAGMTEPAATDPTDHLTGPTESDPVEPATESTNPTDSATESTEKGSDEGTTTGTGPVDEWNKPGKLPDEYTWDEYLALSLEEREAFFLWFDSETAFEAWKERVKPTEPTIPDTGWNKPGKLPEEYTWDEYLALSMEEREAFFLWFDSEAAFEAWMEGVKPTEPTIPDTGWNKPGKLPSEYTWAEYQALNMEEREAFFLWFDSESAFEVWKESVKPTESTAPDIGWDKPGKLPNEYTWEEYQALSHEEQDAFFLWFGSVDAFEAWMEQVKPEESTAPSRVWDKPGKLPNEYTWEEYQALTPEEQDAFFLWFGSVDAFEAWMEQVKPEESTAPSGVWDKPGKLPNEYTWEEYQVLTPEEQDAFFLWFGSVDAFEAWMDQVKPTESTAPSGVWDKPGKLPNEYTWEEYQALTPEEQDAFFLWFESVEAFEAWMDTAKAG